MRQNIPDEEMDEAQQKNYMNIVDPIILLDSIETMEFDTLSEPVHWWPRVFGFQIGRRKM